MDMVGFITLYPSPHLSCFDEITSEFQLQMKKELEFCNKECLYRWKETLKTCDGQSIDSALNNDGCKIVIKKLNETEIVLASEKAKFSKNLNEK
jgi:hypothetical protein